MTSTRDANLPSLAGRDWLGDAHVQAVLGALGGCADGDTRIVGGAVRNALFGRPVKDIDLATRLPPEGVMKRAGEAGLKVVPTGIDHGTVTVIAGGRPFEVTTLRIDVETYGRHARVAFTDDWKEDARRRDFTINALYADAHGKIYDPLGGYPDVVARHIRFIGDADARIGEDYLRIFRFFRLHAEYGEGPLDRHGLAACVRARAGIGQLSAERLGQETRRLLAAEKPLAAVEAMADTGIILDLFSGVAYLASFEELLRIEDLLGLRPDWEVRLAVLGCAVREDAERLFERLRLSRAELARISAAGDGWRDMTPDMSAQKRKVSLYRSGEAAFRDRTLLAWSRFGNQYGEKEWRALFALPDEWQAPKLPWRGADLRKQGIGAGPHVGDILRSAEAAWIAGGFTDDPALREKILHEAVTAHPRTCK